MQERCHLLFSVGATGLLRVCPTLVDFFRFLQIDTNKHRRVANQGSQKASQSFVVCTRMIFKLVPKIPRGWSVLQGKLRSHAHINSSCINDTSTHDLHHVSASTTHQHMRRNIVHAAHISKICASTPQSTPQQPSINARPCISMSTMHINACTSTQPISQKYVMSAAPHNHSCCKTRL